MTAKGIKSIIIAIVFGGIGLCLEKVFEIESPAFFALYGFSFGVICHKLDLL